MDKVRKDKDYVLWKKEVMWSSRCDLLKRWQCEDAKRVARLKKKRYFKRPRKRDFKRVRLCPLKKTPSHSLNILLKRRSIRMKERELIS
jgi:hypothetical protein